MSHKIDLSGMYITNVIFPKRKITLQKRKVNIVIFASNSSTSIQAAKLKLSNMVCHFPKVFPFMMMLLGSDTPPFVVLLLSKKVRG